MICEIVCDTETRATPVESHTFTASLPERKTTFAAGYDVCAYLPDSEYPDGLVLEPFHVVKVPTGLYLAPEPGSTVLVVSRSGMAAKGIIILNSPGVIDSDYRNQVMVLMMNFGARHVIHHGDRIAQLLFVPPGGLDLNVTFDVRVPTGEQRPSAVLTPPDSNRVGGFGSTGK